MASEKDQVVAKALEEDSSYHWWTPEKFTEVTERIVKAMKKDPALLPCMKIIKDEAGIERVWLYTLDRGKVASGESGAISNADDNSSPCPPLCPPGYP